MKEFDIYDFGNFQNKVSLILFGKLSFIGK
jgi:hypothetical protein